MEYISYIFSKFPFYFKIPLYEYSYSYFLGMKTMRYEARKNFRMIENYPING